LYEFPSAPERKRMLFEEGEFFGKSYENVCLAIYLNLQNNSSIFNARNVPFEFEKLFVSSLLFPPVR